MPSMHVLLLFVLNSSVWFCGHLLRWVICVLILLRSYVGVLNSLNSFIISQGSLPKNKGGNSVP